MSSLDSHDAQQCVVQVVGVGRRKEEKEGWNSESKVLDFTGGCRNHDGRSGLGTVRYGV